MRNRKYPGIKKDEQGQMHTLEAIMASTIMIAVLVFAVQATALTPLTSSTANAHIESQIHTLGQDMLTVLDHSAYGTNSDLKDQILDWNGDEYVWTATSYSSRTNSSDILTGPLTEMLELVVIENGIAHNIEFTFNTETGSSQTMSFIYNGDPSDNAVIISRKVLISDTDIEDAVTFASDTGISDVDGSTDYYNIIDVKLTMWRM